MTKDEYVKTLQKEEDDNAQEAEDNGYGSGYYDGLDYAVYLAEKLDEPKKVVIPEFIANDIKYHKKHGSTLRGTLGSTFDQGLESDVYCWFFAANGEENVRKYISAWDNGYEVEKQRKQYVKICNHPSGYLNIDTDTIKWDVDTKKEMHSIKTKFTDKEIEQLKQRDDIPLDWNKVTFEEAEND